MSKCKKNPLEKIFEKLKKYGNIYKKTMRKTSVSNKKSKKKKDGNENKDNKKEEINKEKQSENVGNANDK